MNKKHKSLHTGWSRFAMRNRHKSCQMRNSAMSRPAIDLINKHTFSLNKSCKSVSHFPNLATYRKMWTFARNVVV